MQELLRPDYEKRVQYCNWFNQNLNNDEMLDSSFFSDEAWFHLTGYVNKQNYRMWSAEAPGEFLQTPLHPIKIGVWIAMSRRRIIGPIFFEDTITADRYITILNRFINELHDDELRQGYFQHDNAPAHTALRTRQYLQQFYDDRIIAFPPRSPDLTALDYFLFGYLKNTIYRTPLHTLQELKDAITAACANITVQQLQNVFNSMKRRVGCCINNNGAHFEHEL